MPARTLPSAIDVSSLVIEDSFIHRNVSQSEYLPVD